MSLPNVGILATGSYLPEREVSNEEIAELVGVTPEWIERKTRIRSRRYAAPHEAASDLAARAAARALEQAGVEADAVRYLIVSTSTGDHPQPPTSYLVQHTLGADRAACFDINVVCSGFVYALAVAHALVHVDPSALALVIGADVYSRILDFTDRRTAILFADGAGAALVGVQPQPYGLVGVDLISEGSAHGLIRVQAGGSRHPASRETVERGGHFFRMDGRGVRDYVADRVPDALRDHVRRHGLRTEDIGHFVPHQANGVMLDDLVEQAGIGHAHTHRTLHKFGNVGSASVPITLDEANRSGALADGDLVLLAGFGGGMAMGMAMLRWWAPRVESTGPI